MLQFSRSDSNSCMLSSVSQSTAGTHVGLGGITSTQGITVVLASMFAAIVLGASLSDKLVELLNDGVVI